MEPTEQQHDAAMVANDLLRIRRFTPDLSDPLRALEHYHRYLYASRFVRNKRVIDVACGEGYGTAFMSLNAHEAVGVDADAEVIERARNKYNADFPKARYESARGEDLAFFAGSFDVAISFGTFELLEPSARSAFLKNLKQTLVPGGVCIVSIPDRIPPMEGEVGDFTAIEFADTLKEHFRSAVFVGQRPVTVSGIWSLYNWRDDSFRFHTRENLFALPAGDEQFTEPTCIIAVCSDEYLPREIAENSKSFYYDTTQTDRIHETLARARKLEQEVHELHVANARLHEQDEERQLHIERLQRQVADQNQILLKNQSDLTDRLATIAALKKDIQENQSSIETLQQAYDLRTSRANALKDDNGALLNKIAELEAMVSEREADTIKETEAKILAENRILDYENRMKELSALYDRAEEEKAKYRTEVTTLEKLLDEQGEIMKKHEEEVAVLQSRIIHMENLSGEKSEHAQSAQAALENAEIQITNLQHQLHAHDEQIKRVIEENNILRVRNRELESQAEQVKSMTASSNGELQRVKTQLTDLQKQVEEKTVHARRELEEKEHLLVQFYELRKQHDTDRTTAELSKAEAHRLHAQVQALQKQVEEQLSRIQNAGAETASLQAKLADMQKVADQRNAQISKLQKELDETRLNLTHEIEQANAQIVSLQSVHDGRDLQIEHLEKQVKDQTEFLRNLQREYDAQVMLAREAKAELNKQLVAFDTYQKSQVDLQQRYNRSQIKVQELQATITMLEKNVQDVTKSAAYKALSSIGLVPKGKNP